MSRKGALGPTAFVGALLIAAAAYAAQPSWSGPEGSSRTMPMGWGTMMGPGMMGHGSGMGMMPPGELMQEMMEPCQQMMQSWTKGWKDRGRPQDEAPRTPDDPG